VETRNGGSQYGMGFSGELHTRMKGGLAGKKADVRGEKDIKKI